MVSAKGRYRGWDLEEVGYSVLFDEIFFLEEKAVVLNVVRSLFIKKGRFFYVLEKYLRKVFLGLILRF